MLESQILTALYSKRKTPAEFNWDNLFAPSLMSLMTPYNMDSLYNVASSIRYAGNVPKKEAAIKNILEPLGFRRLGAGTNRLVYSFLENKDFLIKVAIDKTGCKNTPDEFKNQVFLKPFVTKCFEYHPSGVVGSFERVMPITNIEEFLSVWDDIFEVIVNMIGEFVIEDIGTQFFMNWAIRKNFGPVLCDYPEVFRLDGNKLFCTKPIIPGQKMPVCGGTIDYDGGFNYLVCQVCNKQYKASDISKALLDKLLIMKGEVDMRVQLVRGNEVLVDNTNNGTDVIKPAPKKIVQRSKTIVATWDDGKLQVPEEQNNEITNQIANAMKGVDMKDPNAIKEAALKLAQQRVEEKIKDKPTENVSEELKDYDAENNKMVLEIVKQQAIGLIPKLHYDFSRDSFSDFEAMVVETVQGVLAGKSDDEILGFMPDLYTFDNDAKEAICKTVPETLQKIYTKIETVSTEVYSSEQNDKENRIKPKLPEGLGNMNDF